MKQLSIRKAMNYSHLHFLAPAVTLHTTTQKQGQFAQITVFRVTLSIEHFWLVGPDASGALPMHCPAEQTLPPAPLSCASSCLPRFLLLWSAVLIMYPTSLAVIALTFSNYVLQPIFPNCVPPYNASRILSMVCLREYLLLTHTQSLPQFYVGPLEGPQPQRPREVPR